MDWSPTSSQVAQGDPMDWTPSTSQVSQVAQRRAPEPMDWEWEDKKNQVQRNEEALAGSISGMSLNKTNSASKGNSEISDLHPYQPGHLLDGGSTSIAFFCFTALTSW